MKRSGVKARVRMCKVPGGSTPLCIYRVVQKVSHWRMTLTNRITVTSCQYLGLYFESDLSYISWY